MLIMYKYNTNSYIDQHNYDIIPDLTDMVPLFHQSRAHFDVYRTSRCLVNCRRRLPNRVVQRDRIAAGGCRFWKIRQV